MNKIQKTVPIQIRTSTDADLPGILAIHRAAYPDESVADAARTLLDNKWGCLPVVSDHGDLLGIVTEADFLRLTVRLLA